MKLVLCLLTLGISLSMVGALEDESKHHYLRAGWDPEGLIESMEDESSDGQRELTETFVVTIKLQKSGNNALTGQTLKSINFFKPNCCGKTFTNQVTDGNGEVKVSLDTTYKANPIAVTLNYINTLEKMDVDLSGDSPSVTFTTTTAKIRVTKPNGSGLGGVPVTYFTQNVGGGDIGTTNNQGFAEKQLLNGKGVTNSQGVSFSARYANTNAVSGIVNYSNGEEGATDHTFKTTNVVITASECGFEAHQAPIPDVEITYFNPNVGGGNVGKTGDNGRATTFLFPGTYQFTAKINKTSQTEDFEVKDNGYAIDGEFHGKKMNFGYTGGSVTFFVGNVGTGTVADGSFLFPGTYNWKFGSAGPFAVQVTECEA